MNWIILTTEAQLQELLERSAQRPQLIYKHSTRCGISSAAKNRLENSPPPPDMDFYYLDVVADRALSQQIAADLNVRHESPQVLLIYNGQCVYDDSHQGIRMDRIAAQKNSLQQNNDNA